VVLSVNVLAWVSSHVCWIWKIFRSVLERANGLVAQVFLCWPGLATLVLSMNLCVGRCVALELSVGDRGITELREILWHQRADRGETESLWSRLFIILAFLCKRSLTLSLGMGLAAGVLSLTPASQMKEAVEVQMGSAVLQLFYALCKSQRDSWTPLSWTAEELKTFHCWFVHSFQKTHY
jgi:hypothetical protein